jgi:transcriptional regulator GlxA family with amidase domain
MQVFSTATGYSKATTGIELYDLIVASVDGGAVMTSTGLQIVAQPLHKIGQEQIDTIIVPGGRPDDKTVFDTRLVAWLAENGPRFRRVCSVCVGAFLLAEAGLLAGRSATTHWDFIETLKRKCAGATVLDGPIFVQDGNIWSSAGVSAGIDLALHLVEADHGRKLAMDVAKMLVVYFRRPGNQHQFSTSLSLQASTDTDFSDLLTWAAGHLKENLSVEVLANRSGMSMRSFTRKFRAAVGSPPAAAIEKMRFEEAKRLLSEGNLPLKRVAAVCGFRDEQTLRRAFHRIAEVSPSEYRQRFS